MATFAELNQQNNVQYLSQNVSAICDLVKEALPDAIQEALYAGIPIAKVVIIPFTGTQIDLDDMVGNFDASVTQASFNGEYVVNKINLLAAASYTYQDANANAIGNVLPIGQDKYTSLNSIEIFNTIPVPVTQANANTYLRGYVRVILA